MTRDEVKQQLLEVQKGCRKRKLDPFEAWGGVQEVATFLVGVPVGTRVKNRLSDRLPNSYNYPAEATYIYGRKDDTGHISIEVRRGEAGFGNRKAIVKAPEDYKVTGPKAHPGSGSTHELSSTKIVRKDQS